MARSVRIEDLYRFVLPSQPALSPDGRSVAFVVKRGVRAWSVVDGEAEKGKLLDYHQRLDLTGKTRRLGGSEFWATRDGRWVRLEDVTVIRERHEMPTFATATSTPPVRWLDVSVVTGTLVAYEGTKAVFATLVSVGKDRLGVPGGSCTRSVAQSGLRSAVVT